VNLKEAAEITRPLGAKRHPDLKHYEYDDLGLGWCLHCWYDLEWDEGEAVVQIEAIDLNTGQHVLPLTVNDVPAVDLIAIESLIADEEYEAAYQAAKALHESRNDDGYEGA
jgi:hypothetical protein